jgi:hypothetical protein
MSLSASHPPAAACCSAPIRSCLSGVLFILLAAVVYPTGLCAQAPVPPPQNVATNALRFNGERAQGVEVPETQPSPYNVEHALTIEAWVNVTAWNKRFQALVTKGDAWGLVRADEQKRLSFRTAIPGAGEGFHDLVSTVDFPLGVWTHVAAVWTGSRKQLYMNGELVADAAYTDGVTTSPFPVMIGGDAQYPERTFTGIIDSVRLWSVTRTANQIKLYRAENLRGSEAGLTGEWRFNEDAGSVAEDNSAGGRDAILRASKPKSGPGILPQRVNGLALAAPSGGSLAVYFNNRTVQFPSALGGPPVATLQQVALPGAYAFESGLTAEMWIKPQALPEVGSGYVSVLSKGAAAWEVRYRDTGKVTFYTEGVQSSVPEGDVQELISKTRVEPNVWTHVAVIWDPVAKLKSLYINGTLDSSTPAEGTLGQTVLPLTVGLQPGATAPPNAYFGAVDELRLWSIVRTGQEILNNSPLGVNGTEPGLTGVWSFDEASGTTAVESSGRSAAGEPSADMSSLNRVDGVALGTPRLASYTVDFNGTNQFLTIADAPSLNGFTNMTLEAWIQPQAPKSPEMMMILRKGEAGYGLAVDADMYLRYMVSGNALKSTTKVTQGVWNHVAAVVDATAGTTTFYINGKPAGSFNSTVIPQSTGALCIGKTGGTVLSHFFHGGIDEVRIWNSVRTPTEILLLAFSELGGTTAGLAGHWSFTEGSGNTIADNAGNKTATLSGLTGSVWKAGPIFPQVTTLPEGLNLTQNPRAAGLWIGEVVLSHVNEVQKAVNGAAEAVSPTGKEATIRILLHVDASGQVRLLKDLIVMQTQAAGVPLPPARPVLVTDPSKIHLFEGVVRRSGKMVGLRYSTVAFDFPGFEMTMIGGIGPGAACGGRIDIAKNTPTNPYRHKFHPDHGEGFDIIRVFSLEFDGMPADPLKAAPGYGVDRITGVYRESIAGLHKITLKTEGIVTLNRISTVPTLNAP